MNKQVVFAPASMLLAVQLVWPEAARGQDDPSFVNFETAHVHPLELAHGGGRLLAVNTADAQLEIFAVGFGTLEPAGSVPVGLDPVSVRATGNGRAWVVNRLSDSVSIVDLDQQRVVATLPTLDEPCDVVFAGLPVRAFVSCSQQRSVLVFDPSDLAAEPAVVELDAEAPRALAVSPDGAKVYVAMFESGNRTTILGGGGEFGPFPLNVVSNPATPYGGVNPPPNAGTGFDPPVNPVIPTPLKVGLIVRQDPAGAWRDDVGTDWTEFVSGSLAAQSNRPVGWTLLDHDVAVIDAATLQVGYVDHLMNLDMALAVNPISGVLAVVGTDAMNHVRFEPNQRGTFIRVLAALADPGTGAAQVVDLNPHLDYSAPTIPPIERELSLGDPRGIAWSADGKLAWITGMGSNNVVTVDATGARVGLQPIEVGQGPTGIVLDDAHGFAYVLNRFEASVSILGIASRQEVARVGFHDATPAAVRAGRPLLYDTHATSGLGQASCASCHIDAHTDRLAWDLGDPSGETKLDPDANLDANNPLVELNPVNTPFHPMKGPMLTQTLQDIIGKEPLHWRGDRDGIEQFAGAYVSLQGLESPPSDAQMKALKNMLATVYFPPNPHRNLDNTLKTSLPLPGHFTTGNFGEPPGKPLPNGDAVHGLAIFRGIDPLQPGAACTKCHTLPTGEGTDMTYVDGVFVPIPLDVADNHHLMLKSASPTSNKMMKVPQLRSLYLRTGLNFTQPASRAGFGVIHNGSFDSIERFVASPGFGAKQVSQIADLVAFLLSLSGSDLPSGSVTDPLAPPGVTSRDAHAAVGKQATLGAVAPSGEDRAALAQALAGLAAQGAIGLVAKGPFGGQPRGFALADEGLFQSDRATETVTLADLLASAAPGAEITFTGVPKGSEVRLGIDRDQDGFLDRDELDAASDPADPLSIPGAWTDLGGALAGSQGVPALTGTGSMLAGTPVSYQLGGAAHVAASTLVFGLSVFNLPFKGGTLVPAPDVVIPGFTTDGGGKLTFGGTLPTGLPSGTLLVAQAWIVDGVGPHGLAASNGLSSKAP